MEQKDWNHWKKGTLSLLCVILIAAVLEVFYFNFKSIKMLASPAITKNITFNLGQMELKNWSEDGGGWVSAPDPIIVIPEVNTYVQNIHLDIGTESLPNQIKVFYTENDSEVFTKERMIVIQKEIADAMDIAVGRQVKDIRLDLGEEAGLAMHSLSVTLNAASISFSISRFSAIIIIYLSAKGLFRLQKSPDYKL